MRLGPQLLSKHMNKYFRCKTLLKKCFSTEHDVSKSLSRNDTTIGVKQALLWTVLVISNTLLRHTNSPNLSSGKWKTRPHCSLRSHADACGWLEARQGFHSSGALKMPMMPRLRTRLMTSTPMVPRKEGIAPWATSHARRDVMSAITPSIWKWVPTTALTWKSWWLWPERGGKTACETRGLIFQYLETAQGWIFQLCTHMPKHKNLLSELKQLVDLSISQSTEDSTATILINDLWFKSFIQQQWWNILWFQFLKRETLLPLSTGTAKINTKWKVPQSCFNQTQCYEEQLVIVAHKHRKTLILIFWSRGQYSVRNKFDLLVEAWDRDSKFPSDKLK